MKVAREMPPLVTIYPTSQCFRKCRHCLFVQNGTLNGQSLDFARLREVLADLAEHKVLLVGVAGGDPLKFPELIDLLKEIVSLRMVPILTLSGSALSEEKISELYAAGVRSVQLSLDGASADIHDGLRGRGSFDETVLAIQTLQKTGISVSLAICLMQQNLRELGAILDLAYDLRISKIKIQRWRNYTAHLDSNFREVSPEEFGALKQAEAVQSRDSRLQIYFDKDEVSKSGSRSFAIGADGNMAWSDLEKPFGNIYEHLPSVYFFGEL